MEIDQATLDLLAKTAAEDATKSYSFLNSPRESGAPEWKAADTFTTDAEAVVRTDEAARGFMRFAAGVKAPVEETPWLLAIGNERPKRPNSFADESKWDLWTGGRPKDPWAYRTRVPVEIKTGPWQGASCFSTATMRPPATSSLKCRSTSPRRARGHLSC